MDKLKVGVIGCGRMTSTIEDEVRGRKLGGIRLPHSHAAAYVTVDEVELVAACDIMPDKLKEFQERWGVPRGYTDFREMIDTEDLDILSIGTRPEQHAEPMIYGAENGIKGMYAEKPLCCTLEEADAIKEAFERNGVFLEFGPMRRNWAVYRQAREIAESGELGAVESIVGFAGNSVGGHYLDTLLYLIGDPDPVAIRGTLSELNPAEGDTSGMHFVRDTPIKSALVEFADGKTMYIAGAGIGLEFELVCENGVIRTINDGDSLVVRKAIEGTRFYQPFEVPEVEHWSGTVRKIRELAQAIRTGVPGVSNLRATMIGTEIGFGIYESHLNGGTVVHPPVPNRNRFVSSW